MIDIGSVAYLAGTPAELASFVTGKNSVIDVQIAYSGTAGSYIAFVLQDIQN